MVRPLGVVLLAIVPALALAAPRRPHRPAPPKKTPPAKVEPKAAEPPPPAAGSGSDAGAGSGSADVAPTPPPPPAPVVTAPPEPEVKADAIDVDTLRQEYLSLRDELFKSRARANAVASALYSTRVQIKLTYTSARYYNPAKASIRLDGATVFEDAKGTIGGDDGVRFDGFIAPGRHLVTFRIEATGKDDDSFTSTTEAQIVVKAVSGKDLVVTARAKDGGDIAYEWKKHEKGSYGLAIDVGVKTQKPEGATK